MIRQKKGAAVAAPFFSRCKPGEWLPLLGDVGDQRDAEALSLYRFDDADDDQHDEANPDGATEDVNAAAKNRDESKDDLQDHPTNLRSEKSQAVLGVPLQVGVVLLHQQRNQGEEAKIRKDEKDGSVAAVRGGR